jgi:hypothetical protein
MLVGIINAPLARRRALALGFAVLISGLPLSVAAMTIGGLLGKTADIEAGRERLGRLLATTAAAQRIEPLVERSDQSEGLFLARDDEPAMRNGLQMRLAGIAARNDVAVVYSDGAPPLLENDVRYVGLRAHLSGPIEAIHGALFGLETSLPALFLRKVTLRATGQPGRQHGPQELFAELVFYGAVRPDAVPVAKP